MRCPRCKRNTSHVNIKGVIHCASCGGKAPSWIYKNAALVVTLGLIVLAATLFASYKIALYKHNNPTAQRPPSGCSDDGMAWVMARKYVKKHLTSPSSAKFNSLPVRSDKAGECSFFFGGEFEASNAFGVMMAKGFTVKITYNPVSDSYTGTELFIWP